MTLSQQGAPYQGLHQQISIYIRRKTDNSLVNQTIIAKFAPILQGVEVHILNERLTLSRHRIWTIRCKMR